MHHVVSDEPLFFIAHNSVDLVHWGEVSEGRNISTGQPELELFKDRAEWIERLRLFGVDPDSEEPWKYATPFSLPSKDPEPTPEATEEASEEASAASDEAPEASEETTDEALEASDEAPEASDEALEATDEASYDEPLGAEEEESDAPVSSDSVDESA